ncbi:FYRN-domain-containing protein [Lactarius indigo]|nr:FYRN-domain-containing protein [Lactarius indigo]
MSRRSAPMLPPPPPTDRDVIMGPPPVPPQPLTPSSMQNSKDQREFSEKYYKLKRKYWELEEAHLEDELRRSGERNTNWNTERGMLLDRILELEATVARQPSSPSPHSPGAQPPTQPPTAYPRALQSAHAQTAFQANLREAFNEISSEDPSVDPLYTSRHLGPQARKRQLEEIKEREEEEARDARKTPRRGKAVTAAPNPSKTKDTGVPPSFVPPTNNSGAPPATAPGTSPQTLVAPSGKRIRIKPPTAAPPEPAPPLPRSAALSPGSPMSPLGSDAEPYAVADGESSTPLRNGNGTLDTPIHTGPGSPTSLGPSAASIPPTTVQRHTKPKRLKAHTVTSKSYSIPMVPRDKGGRPVLPLNVGIMTVNCLGEVCMREHFHTERYIFPVGYSVNRRYLSARDPNAETVYNCTILDGGDGPKFQIIANDMADKPIIAGTATGAWSVVVRAANHVRNRQHSNSVSGPDFFGLGQNTIKHLIQELPGADRLKDYVWQNFVEGG